MAQQPPPSPVDGRGQLTDRIKLVGARPVFFTASPVNDGSTMAKLGGKRPPEFMSTHPGPEHRAQALEGWMPEALALYRRSQPQNGTRPLPGVSRDASRS